MKVILCLLFLSLFSNLACAETFSECVLENLRNARINTIAREVKQACKKKVLPYTPAACAAIKIPAYVSNGDNEINLTNDPYEQFMLKYSEKAISERTAVNKVYYEALNKKERCIEKCLEASWWDKRFGDCKP